MKKFFIFAIISILVFSLSACGKKESGELKQEAQISQPQTNTSKSEETVVYKIKGGHANPTTHPYNLGLEKFSQLLSERSNGQISLDTFSSSQLGNERDLVEGMQLGSVDVGVITSAPLSGFTDAYLVFDLPFIFKNVEEARKVCDSEVGDEMLKSLESSGIIGLTFFENGMRSITNSKRPIETPEDLKGIKIRTMENPMHMEAFNLMGADPTPMAFGELFTALQQKAIDAQENPFVVIYASKFFEVQDYLSVTEHLYSPAPLMMSAGFYNSLDEDFQKAVTDAAAEAKVYQRAACDKQTAELLSSLEKSGMKINFPEKDEFVEATKGVYDKFIGKGKGLVNPEVYNKIKEILK